MNTEYLLDTIHNIYEASYKNSKWPQVLENIAHLIGAGSGAMLYRYHEIDETSGSYRFNIPEELIQLYNSGRDDPNYSLMVNAAPLGQAIAADDIIGDRIKLEDYYGDYYLEVMKPFNHYHIAGIFFFNDEKRAVGMGFQRSQSVGPWSQSELQILTDLAPHLQRSLHIHKEFTRLRAQEYALKSGMDQLLMGIVLLDDYQQIVYCNPIATSIIDYHPALKRHANRIFATNSIDNKRINDALIATLNYEEGGDASQDPTTIALGLKHANTAIPLPIIITPINNSDFTLEATQSNTRSMILMSDPEQNQPIVPEALQTAYELTPKESSIAIGIANGYSVKEIAEQQNTKPSSVKSHLKSVYTKLGISRQTELVKILLTGPFRVNF